VQSRTRRTDNPRVPAIVLTTLNARWSHAALGLRYLRANLGALREDSEIVEFTIARPVEEIVADLVARAPRLVGFGVYLWNVAQTTRVIERLKAVAPQITAVVGGPEVSHEVGEQRRHPAAAGRTGAALRRVQRHRSAPAPPVRRGLARLPVQVRVLPVGAGQDGVAVSAGNLPA
jgi:hypothetical protein